MTSGIYDQKGRLIKSTIDRLSENETVQSSGGTTPIGQNTLVGRTGSAFSNGNYQGNIVIKDRGSVVAVFIGIA